jgi:hypothetical protein
MYHDAIIDEVWKNRETIAKRCHNNLHEIVLELQRRQKASLSEIVDKRHRIGGPMMCRETHQP